MGQAGSVPTTVPGRDIGATEAVAGLG
jgi:hypothetical protein